ncbi:helix-turn-helix domain-containing protein [Brevibacillus laterosporus]|uniref:helix-turn-helix domain-containing protein n=1 Tax=Brevibacillus laterosporus TaxID=1465 RepID=UPI000E6BEC89|nr:helix-turn-helix transcriptional regulator [Brevibacillus laterosporus]AYB38521.1 XRE family transcriptional regulator [Brevibacillus laterosporus]MBM7111468.1 helix-turn-helix protein [Brevibacillus laterosporus]
MIKCNLAVLMAERGLKIVDVARETGISKTTLGALFHNSGKGVQFETLEKLCDYFNVTPGELLSRISFGIKIKSVTVKSYDECEYEIEIIMNDESIQLPVRATIQRVEDEEHEHEINININHKIAPKIITLPNQYLMDEFAYPIALSVLKDLNIGEINYSTVVSFGK